MNNRYTKFKFLKNVLYDLVFTNKPKPIKREMAIEKDRLRRIFNRIINVTKKLVPIKKEEEFFK